MTKERDINLEEELLSSSESIDRKLNDQTLEDFANDLMDSEESDSSKQTTSSSDGAVSDLEAKDKNEAISAVPSNEIEKIQTEMESLAGELKQAKDKAEENWDHFVRAKAELENLRRRSQRDVENAHKYASEKFIQGLLPVIDSLEMGAVVARQDDATIDKLLEGMELTVKMFADILEKFEIERLDPTGETFNPEFHQAMSMQESADSSPNTVLAVMQKGYKIKDRLIRPAMVVVSKAVESAKATKSSKAKSKDGLSKDDGEQKEVGTNIDEKA
ncbi:MAG: nucleotide exchange factor GrpE [Thiohalomonadales bacterium]